MEDGVGGCGPGKGAAFAVVVLDELVDAGDQIADAAEAAATDGPLGNQSEPAFHLIEPGRISGRVVDVVTGPCSQPDAYFGVFVGGIVVHDQMHVQLRWNCGIDALQKTEEFLMQPRLAESDSAGGDSPDQPGYRR